MRAAMAESVQRGVAFLEAVVGVDGAWTGRRYRNLQLTGPSVEEQPPFIAALGVLALAETPGGRPAACDGAPVACGAHGVSRRVALLADAAAGRRRHGGVLARGRPAPVDPVRLVGGSVERMLALRDEAGRFPTLIVPRRNTSSWFRNDYDAVVNAYVLAYLGDHPDTVCAQRWVEGLIEQETVDGEALVHYADAMDLYAAEARACLPGRCWRAVSRNGWPASWTCCAPRRG